MRVLPLLLAALPLAACLQPDTVVWRASLAGSDAGATEGSELGPGCQGLSYQGCCSGDTLRYCAAGLAHSVVCGPGAHCGWDPVFSLYGCGSSSAADPSGSYPMACPATDAGVEVGIDLTSDDSRPGDGGGGDLGGCGDIGYAGCCLDELLFFCSAGKLISVDCGSASWCGWNAGRGFYSCATSGQSDPSGAYPRLCGTLPPDAGPATDGPFEAGPEVGSGDGIRERGAGADASSDALQPPADWVPAGQDGRRDLPGRDSTGLDPSGLDVPRPDAGLTSADSGCSCSLLGACPPGGGLIALLLFGAVALRGRARRLLPLLSIGAALLAAASCRQPANSRQAAGRQSAALGPADVGAAGDHGATDQGKPIDATGLDAGGCPLPFEGCCDGETLWWCEEGALKSLNCGARLHCGFSDNNLYDCNTSGGQDPSGDLPKLCSLRGVTLPSTDAAIPEAGTPCQGLSREGCCAGQLLYYCDDGQLKHLSCGLNPKCGWQANGQLYDCGTSGAADPSGRHPQQCPAGLPDAEPGPADASPLVDLRDRGPVGGDAGEAADGCSCELGGASGGPMLILLLVALLRLAAGAARRHSADQVR